MQTQLIPGSSDPLPRIRRDEVAKARGWLRESFPDSVILQESVNVANAITVVALVNERYEGGWDAFVKASAS